MGYRKMKEQIREATESQPLTMYAKKTEEGVSVYPYCVLPFEGNDEILDIAVECLVRMYRKTFGSDDGITTLLFPEAKAFLFSDVAKKLKKRGVLSRKRCYGVENEIEVKIETPYRGESKMHCVGVTEKDKRIVGVDDMFSGAMTAMGHIDAFEQAGLDVPGFLSFYHRGDGLNNLRERYPDKIFEGFARLEIKVPEEFKEELKERYHKTNNDNELKERFLKELLIKELTSRYGNLHIGELNSRFADDHDFKDPALTDDERKKMLNHFLRPRITRFFDD